MVRYIILIALNIPVLLLAFTNLLTQYKLRKISKRKAAIQFVTWFTITGVIVLAFPVYNILSGNPPFEAYGLSSFDIIQTTAIIYMLYIINQQRQRVEKTEKTIRGLHQELSITLSDRS